MTNQIGGRRADWWFGPHGTIAILVIITSLAAALRFYHLGTWSLWIDEIYTLDRAKAHGNLAALLAEWWKPSISLFLTVGSTEFFGSSAWSARLGPALIGIASVPILYFPIKRLFGTAVALISVLLLAVSPWHLEWSQNARFYTSLLLFYFLAAFVFFIAIERDRPLFLLLFGVLSALAVGERYLALLLFPVVFTYLAALAILPFPTPAGLRKRNVALLLFPIILVALFELIRFITTGSSYLMQELLLTYSLPIGDPLRLVTFIAFNIGIPLACLACFATLYLFLERSRAGLFVILNAIVPIVLLMIANPFYFTKDRYALMTLPFWLVLAAVAIREIYAQSNGFRRIFASGVLALLLADAGANNLLYFRANNGNRHDWKGAFSMVQELGLPDDQVVAWWPEFGPFYLDRQIIPWNGLNPQFVVNSGRRFWFILDEETVWGNRRMKSWVEKNGELMDIKYLRRPTDTHLRIYRYDPERRAAPDLSSMPQ